MFRRIDAVVGNLRDFVVEGRRVEHLAVPSAAMARRLVRLSSSAGDLGIVFEDGTRLRNGDVVFADAHCVIAIEVVPDDVLVAYPDSIGQAVEIAHALGNRHVPLIRDGDAIIVGFADPLQAVLERSGVRWERTKRVLDLPFVHAAAPHAHA